MLLTKDDLRQRLRSRDFAPVYVLFGAETYLRDLAAKTISDLSFSASDLRDFNDTTFALEHADDLPSAIAAAQQLPMMAARRVVRITGVKISATGARDTVTEAHEPILSAYFADPSPSSVVIMIADELNGVRKMGKFLREHATVVEFGRLDDRELTEFARREVSDNGTQIDEDALRQLIMRAGNDVRRLSNEVAKLAAASMPLARITIEHVESLVPNSRELSNFDLTDHLVAGRRRDALAALKKILDDGAEPLALLGLISYNFRRLLIAKDLMDRSVPRSEVASAVKLFGRGQDVFLGAARKAEKEKLATALKLIARTDVSIKNSIGGSGPTGSRLLLEKLVCELAL